MNEIIVYDMFRSKWHDALNLALIEKAEELIAKDIHPTTIVDGYRKSADKAIEVLGGAPEAHVAGKLAEWAGTLSGREQLAAQKFSEALEVIPLVLAENAGMDPIDTITDLPAKQSKGSKWTGVDVRSRKVADISKIEIFEPVIKEQIIKSATEAASMLLRIDDVIAASALDDLGNHTGAIEYYDKALALNPHYVDALDNEGIALDEIGNHVGAMHLYDRALAIMPKDIYALDNKGETLHDLGNYTGAMHLYDKTLTIDSKFENVLYDEGLALDKMGNHTGALTYLDIEYGVLC